MIIMYFLLLLVDMLLQTNEYGVVVSYLPISTKF